MHRIFVSQDNIKDDNILITKEEAKHAFSVLRIRAGDQVNLFDGKGTEYFGNILSLNSKQGIVKIAARKSIKQDPIKITLAAALPKLSKFEAIVDKSTQLGVSKLIPLVTQRTIIKIKDNKTQDKLHRWQKIAIEAAKQCYCSYIPLVEQIGSLDDVLKKSNDYNLILIPSLLGKRSSLKKTLKIKKPKSILVLIGPEGDFTETEVRLALNKGAVNINLGKNVLRCETAVVMVLSALNYEWKL